MASSLVPDKKIRRFKTAANETVTWTWDPSSTNQRDTRDWGNVTCTGCDLSKPGVLLALAKKHAAECREMS